MVMVVMVMMVVMMMKISNSGDNQRVARDVKSIAEDKREEM